MSPPEIKFLTLSDAMLELGTATTIYAKRRTNTRICVSTRAVKGKRLNPIESANIMPKLIGVNGELYAGRWAASSDTCKALNYETILVNFE
jgi:hypothetical protein